MNNKYYSVLNLNKTPASREDYLQAMRDFYSDRPEKNMFNIPKEAIRFVFHSEGMITVNPMEINANLILLPRNEEWIQDLEELAGIEGKFSLKEASQ